MTETNIDLIIDDVLKQARSYRPDLQVELAHPQIRATLIEAYKNPAIIEKLVDNFIEVSPQAARSSINPLVYLATLAIILAGGIRLTTGNVSLININVGNGQNQTITTSEQPSEEKSQQTTIPQFDPIYFDLGENNIRDSEVDKHNPVANYLKNNPQRKVKLTGYTDRNPGEAEKAHDPLSLKRAKTSKNQLLFLGVKEEQIEISGQGHNKPILDENGNENEAKSRRVEIIIF